MSFNIDGAPDPTKWNFENGFSRNEEAQWYQRDNATVKDGFLVIEARREQKVQSKLQSGRQRLAPESGVRRLHLVEFAHKRHRFVDLWTFRDAWAH